MKPLKLPIHIVDGTLTCPHCAGDLKLVGAAAMGEEITPTFICRDCNKVVGMNFYGCRNGHLHMGWVEMGVEGVAIMPDQELTADLEVN
jgi:hypothetical protein